MRKPVWMGSRVVITCPTLVLLLQSNRGTNFTVSPTSAPSCSVSLSHPYSIIIFAVPVALASSFLYWGITPNIQRFWDFYWRYCIVFMHILYFGFSRRDNQSTTLLTWLAGDCPSKCILTLCIPWSLPPRVASIFNIHNGKTVVQDAVFCCLF